MGKAQEKPARTSQPGPRVALFADCYTEVNGVALTCRQLGEHAVANDYPMLLVHAGKEKRIHQWGSLTRLELNRSRLRFAVDMDLDFDLLLGRHLRWVRLAVEEFRPDLLHFTGPGDIGILGAWLGWRLGIPAVASWHTNVHEFAARRVMQSVRWLPAGARQALARVTEQFCLESVIQYYRIPRAIFAPNRELVELLERRTGRPAYLMQRGVDTELFHPRRRCDAGGVFTFGYVGRLTAEKNVRLLAKVEAELMLRGVRQYRFVVVGHGPEQEWLEENLQQAEFPGVLRGEALAEAYANMDVFLFPSHTDAFGNVVQEAQASGVPVVVTASGGPKFMVTPGVDGYVARDDAEFARLAASLVGAEHLPEMGAAARRKAESRSWGRVFEGVYEVYRQVVKDSAVERLSPGCQLA
jgi:glycosyltransferase involved in cell wall biosynthesis